MCQSHGHGGIDANPNVVVEQRLQALASELKARSQQLPLMSGLVFTTPPTINTDTPEMPTMDPNDPKLHRLSLTSGEPVNEPVLGYENWLRAMRSELLQRTSEATQHNSLSAEFEEEFRILQRHKIAEWQRQQEGLKLRECAKSLVDRAGRPVSCPSVETGMYLSK